MESNAHPVEYGLDLVTHSDQTECGRGDTAYLSQLDNKRQYTALGTHTLATCHHIKIPRGSHRKKEKEGRGDVLVRGYMCV